MRSFRRLHWGTAAFQAMLLPVLATAVPSDHHERPHRSGDGVVVDHDHSHHADGTVVIDHDHSHHAHGTVLIDGDDDRTAADAPGLPAATDRRVGPHAHPPLPVTAHRSATIRPRGRAPPPGRSPRPPPTLS